MYLYEYKYRYLFPESEDKVEIIQLIGISIRYREWVGKSAKRTRIYPFQQNTPIKMNHAWKEVYVPSVPVVPEPVVSSAPMQLLRI